MNTESETRTPRTWEITVESEWISTLGMSLLFLICGLLLVREIRHFIWSDLSVPVHLHKGFWNIWDKVFEAIAALYCFMFAARFPKKSVKAACALMGICLAGSVLLSCFRLSSNTQHIAATGRSILSQIALAIFCLVIADWFRSVCRWTPSAPRRGGDI